MKEIEQLSFIVMYSLLSTFLGLSLRTSKALVVFRDDKRSHVSVWNWIQGLVPVRSTKEKE
ncbi:MAG: hypothetical protein MRJ93_13950 [Nitrososphaeraceae archaeon]|nr:hypothetical protein [Nitrososphaeraceae archaeon]